MSRAERRYWRRVNVATAVFAAAFVAVMGTAGWWAGQRWTPWQLVAAVVVLVVLSPVMALVLVAALHAPGALVPKPAEMDTDRA